MELLSSSFWSDVIDTPGHSKRWHREMANLRATAKAMAILGLRFKFLTVPRTGGLDSLLHPLPHPLPCAPCHCGILGRANTLRIVSDHAGKRSLDECVYVKQTKPHQHHHDHDHHHCCGCDVDERRCNNRLPIIMHPLFKLAIAAKRCSTQ